MTVFTIFVGLLISGCYCVSLPGLQNQQTDDEFTKIFGIVPDKSTFRETDEHNINMETKPTIAGQQVKHVQPLNVNNVASGSLENNLAGHLSQLASMSALQLLNVLGIHLPNDLSSQRYHGNNIQKTASTQQNEQLNIPRKQQLTDQEQKPTVQTTSSNNELKTGNDLHIKDENKETAVTGSNQGVQGLYQFNNGGEFNTQQQISPLYMMTAGMGGQQGFPQISKLSENQQSGSERVKTEPKLFDPDALMQHMMASSSSALGSGDYNLKQNIVSPHNWAGQQTGPTTEDSDSKQNMFNPIFGQKSVNFNPDSFNNAQMNFKPPDSLLLSVNKDIPQMTVSFNPDSFNNAQINFKPDALLMSINKDMSKQSEKLSYNPDKVNDYNGMFKPGQMYPVVGVNTPPPSQLMFNADILNKQLMNNGMPTVYNIVNSKNKKAEERSLLTSNLRSTQASEKQHTDSNFIPGLLYPGTEQLNSHLSDLPPHDNVKKLIKDDNEFNPELIQLRFSSEDQPIENETISQTTTIPESIAYQSNVTSSIPETTTPQTTTEIVTTQTTSNVNGNTSGKETSNEVFVPGQSTNLQSGFVPGSLTGDGQTLLMMVANGMFDPNKINQQAFSSNSAVSNSNRNHTSQQETNMFNIMGSFNPSSVNQEKMSFNTNQQMEMYGPSGSVGTSYNSYYDANKVNQNSFINPFDKVQTINNNVSTGMFDNSQFLGSFDPNNANIESFNMKGNNTQNGMDFGVFGGSFNPSDVNKAFFNPNDVNKVHMHFDPSEMLEKNPGYDKDTAENYKFDPNKVNDIHMNFIPPFLQGNNEKNQSNVTGSRFIPGLLSGGGEESGNFDPSKINSGMLFNPQEMMAQSKGNNATSVTNGGSSGSQVMFNPSSMMGNMNNLMSGSKFDPNTLNKVGYHFNPNEMMKAILENGSGSGNNLEGSTRPPIGHGNDDTMK